MPPSPHPPPTAPRPSGVCLASSLNPDRQRLPRVSPQSPGCSPILTGKRGSLTRLLCCKELSCRGCSSLCLLAEHGVQCPGTPRARPNRRQPALCSRAELQEKLACDVDHHATIDLPLARVLLHHIHGQHRLLGCLGCRRPGKIVGKIT